MRARFAREHQGTERRPSNTCAAHQLPPLEHPSEPSRALPCVACMIDHLDLPDNPRRGGLTDGAEVTWWDQPALSLFLLSRLPSFFPAPPSVLVLVRHTHYFSLHAFLATNTSTHSLPVSPFPLSHLCLCYLIPQRIICAIHSFHLSLFLCACPPPGYVGLPGRLRISETSRPQHFHSLRPQAYRYVQNIPFPGSRITLC